DIWTAQIGEDHPEYLIKPDKVPEVTVVIDYDARFPYAFDTDAPPYRWTGRYDDPKNWLILGPRMHAYRPVMAHKLHCVQIIHDAIQTADPDPFFEHVQHCLSYLRQTTLCEADLTLEDPRVMDLDLSGLSDDATHVCGDWNVVWRESERRVDEWRAFSRFRWEPSPETST
ncbi:hypothetical protein AURDEDRAFT_64321, partial [Auricularia subglabra TFB-10046 SS5]